MDEELELRWLDRCDRWGQWTGPVLQYRRGDGPWYDVPHIEKKTWEDTTKD